MEQQEKSTQRINDFLSSLEKSFSKTDGRTFWPGSGGQIAGSFADLEAQDVFEKLKILRNKLSLEEVASLFRTPSNLRYLLIGNYIIGLKILAKNNEISKKDVLDSVNYVFDLLEVKTKSDPFCLKGANLVSSPNISSIPFEKPDNSFLISRLVLSLTSLIWALYYDPYIDKGCEFEGPYDIGENKKLFIRNYFDLCPKELWPNINFKYNSVKLFLIYENSDLSIDYLLHEYSSKSLSSCLSSYAVQVKKDNKEYFLDSKEIEELIDLSLKLVLEQTTKINSLSTLEQIKKGSEICYYSLKEFREYFSESWKPSKKIQERIEKEGLAIWEKLDWKNPERQKIGKNWIEKYDPRMIDF